MGPRGTEFLGEVSNANSGTTFSLYHAASTQAITIQSNQIVVITDIIISGGPAGLVTIYTGTNAAGKRIYVGTKVADTVLAHVGLETPFVGQPGSAPVLVNAGGNANYATITGYILEA